ncbi:hypothetical protein E2C01_001309 [Portunus trituberculatus]|uniref:Uncharacterized protein n=1 Tax=Portunus trituberculatus TaxID=210409 RepID=A0A5B7CHH5_PORTR|nr:hypothetical protein [Portunus trituberculatus]
MKHSQVGLTTSSQHDKSQHKLAQFIIIERGWISNRAGWAGRDGNHYVFVPQRTTPSHTGGCGNTDWLAGGWCLVLMEKPDANGARCRHAALLATTCCYTSTTPGVHWLSSTG